MALWLFKISIGQAFRYLSPQCMLRSCSAPFSLRQPSRSQVQRKHRMGNAELHPAKLPGTSPNAHFQPLTASGVMHRRGHEGDFQLLSSSLSPDFCQLLPFRVLLHHFLIALIISMGYELIFT